MGNELIRVSVDDNGKGFDPEILQQSTNLGLKLIWERSEMLGGVFEIDIWLDQEQGLHFPSNKRLKLFIKRRLNIAVRTLCCQQ